ncbi:hypothetical protein COCSUDRAFT_45662 [Coccomyxa subellipsoidea C-169]|uniref:Uncharacterized protein n=1 Tax=Coccomyxa subellipsoidea (strain C-169) TaxID=574566 RepID=I0YI14_COCSC|nr:hypothetical protein COCSUDRAFT_45662 [Coccomyxa subellipsoidea C-169]EIE18033.1 hypothetical protein COCSUDRAFT_45662 [Coccomyxa subellipsoidea C-169]|eukprot:XP_005642577.1 hypothetical protein COCSUDRAFT_45662 [Coccomyxa subellipsoidea C-169]
MALCWFCSKSSLEGAGQVLVLRWQVQLAPKSMSYTAAEYTWVNDKLMRKGTFKAQRKQATLTMRHQGCGRSDDDRKFMVSSFQSPMIRTETWTLSFAHEAHCPEKLPSDSTSRRASQTLSRTWLGSEPNPERFLAMVLHWAGATEVHTTYDDQAKEFKRLWIDSNVIIGKAFTSAINAINTAILVYWPGDDLTGAHVLLKSPDGWQLGFEAIVATLQLKYPDYVVTEAEVSSHLRLSGAGNTSPWANLYIPMTLDLLAWCLQGLERLRPRTMAQQLAEMSDQLASMHRLLQAHFSTQAQCLMPPPPPRRQTAAQAAAAAQQQAVSAIMDAAAVTRAATPDPAEEPAPSSSVKSAVFKKLQSVEEAWIEYSGDINGRGLNGLPPICAREAAGSKWRTDDPKQFLVLMSKTHKNAFGTFWHCPQFCTTTAHLSGLSKIRLKGSHYSIDVNVEQQWGIHISLFKTCGYTKSILCSASV